MQIIDYDEIETWSRWVMTAIEKVVSPDVLDDLRACDAEFIEDARDLLLSRVSKNSVVEHLASELSSRSVRVYHGTRLTDTELDSVRKNGLTALNLMNRRSALIDVFRRHPRWEAVQDRFDQALTRFGPGNGAGRREDNSVHVCFSRCGLVKGCNHYLEFGAEVDGHVAHAVFGDDSGRPLLKASRQAVLVSFLSPFDEAARAANPFGVPRDDLPSLVNILLGAWAYREAHPAFTVRSQRDCTAARFATPIPADRIELIQRIEDDELRR